MEIKAGNKKPTLTSEDEVAWAVLGRILRNVTLIASFSEIVREVG